MDPWSLTPAGISSAPGSKRPPGCPLWKQAAPDGRMLMHLMNPEGEPSFEGSPSLARCSTSRLASAKPLLHLAPPGERLKIADLTLTHERRGSAGIYALLYPARSLRQRRPHSHVWVRMERRRCQ